MADPLSLRTRRAVDARIHGLRERFGEFPVVDATRRNDPEFFEHGVDLFEAGIRGAAGARVTDDDGRLLLIRDGRNPETWALPAGGHEPGETFPETAEREVWEETGIDCEITGVWRAVRKRFVRRDDPQRRGYLLEVFFTADAAGGAVGVDQDRLDDGENVLAAEWFEEVPADAIPVIEDRTAPPVV
ncbi:ADP-ribose pyrophosphatase [Halolamina pelagica]|uniref:ADP-ribose pyrophosphatase n=1 Tax=Halolamina pelagica TaxID=699431 RepID=A0A0P7HEA7_9EURY|nr:NUDIX domain-containing protein [Halolamina pelagica]KPN32014.1 ADP-ribose pyrophosphatase [Halolamina pelagica]